MNKYKLCRLVFCTAIVLTTMMLWKNTHSAIENSKEMVGRENAVKTAMVAQQVLPVIEAAEEVSVEEQPTEEIIEAPIEETPKDDSLSEYRLTSYYTGDDPSTGSCTGSGLCTSDFQINENGWYTYQGKIVIAAATSYLLNYGYSEVSGRHYFRYYDELTITIDGVDYQAIVLDSCGASMTVAEDRIDLFVSSSNAVIDRGYNGVNPVIVKL